MEKLRFKQEDGTDYPDWEKHTLGEVLSSRSSGNLSKKAIDVDGESHIVLYGELYTKYGERITRTLSKTNVANGVEINYGDILVPTSGESSWDIAKASAFLDASTSRVFSSGDMIIFTPKEASTNSAFLAYLMNSHDARQQVAIKAQGNSVVHVSKRVWEAVAVRLPSLPEQERIASFLSMLDERIEAQRVLVSRLEQEKRGYMQAMLSPTPTLRFKQDDGTDYPDWEKYALGEVLTIRNGADYSPVVDDADEVYPVYGSGGPFSVTNRFHDQGPAILLGRKGTVDKPLFVSGPFWCVDTMFWAKARGQNSPKFLYYAMTRLPFKKLATSGTLPSMTQASLNNHSEFLPSPPEQEKIAQFLGLLDECLLAEKAKLAALELEKKGFAQRVFL